MLPVQEFTRWLRRPEKNFGESLLFATSAWQSMDFSYANKYEEIVDWLASMLPKQIADSSFPAIEFREVLKLRVQPGLVPTITKIKFVNELLALAHQASGTEARIFAELLNWLLCNEWVQDIYRADFKLLVDTYACLIKCYTTYLRQPNITLSVELETEFFKGVMKLFKDFIKSIHDVESFEVIYREKLLQPLTEALLSLRLLDLCFFDELITLEQLLTQSQNSERMIERLATLPIHVQLVVLECALFNRRGDIQFLKMLLDRMFGKQLLTANNPEMKLTFSAFLLVAMRRHDISMNFEWKSCPAVTSVGAKLLKYINLYKAKHLRKVLVLVNCALKFNPFLLEENIFQIMTWLVVVPKQTDEEQRLFEEFLVLAINMFQRLSRAERFLTNFLKVFKEWLSKNKLSNAHCHEVKVEEEIATDEGPTPCKLKKFDSEGKEMWRSDYVHIIFKDYKDSKLSVGEKTKILEQLPLHESFPELKSLWPSGTAGTAFSKLVANLMSKPSMVIWKTLVYCFRDLLDEHTASDLINLNVIVSIELHTTLLCHYFSGSRLAEHVQNCYENVNSLRELTRQLLKQFGHFLLEREHNQRTVKAFLELSYYSTAFDLLLMYYSVDGTEEFLLKPDTCIQQIHGYLTDAEWTLIQQRVLNFDKDISNNLFSRLETQRLVAGQLIQSKLNIQNEATIKQTILINNFKENQPTTKLTALKCFEEFCEDLASNKVDGLLSLVLHKDTLCHTNIEKRLETMTLTINMYNKEFKTTPRSLAKPMSKTIQQLRLLPVAFLRSEQKFDIFLRLLALYRDALVVNEYSVASDSFEFILDFMFFGDRMPILKYFTMSQLLKLLPLRNCLRFYELMFSIYIRQDEKGAKSFLKSLASMLDLEVQQMGIKLSEEHRQILLLTINTLANLSGPSEKSMHAHLKPFLVIYHSYLDTHFSQKHSNQEDADFVKLTIPAFIHYVKATISKANTDKDTAMVDKDFIRISKIYIGHTLNYRSMDNVRLMTIALIHREALDLQQDEIELVLSGYWHQICEDLKSNSLSSSECMSSALKLIINNKSNVDLLLTLRELDTKAKAASESDENDLRNVLSLLGLIAKCSFTSIKGAIFNEQFRLITTNILLRFNRTEQQYRNSTLVLGMLVTQQAIVENRSVPMSSDTIDSIIEFLQNINIKKYSLKDGSLQHFESLHSAMTELCLALLKTKAKLLMERVPQMMYIFKNLLQAIVWYKNELQKDTGISEMEVSTLARCALKLANFMELIKINGVAVKRIAPFALLFTINLMAVSKRPTTLHPQIKIHVENICYALIGICDHRVGRFIMRNSNEAGRQLYELLCKQHKKYKFKGKV